MCVALCLCLSTLSLNSYIIHKVVTYVHAISWVICTYVLRILILPWQGSLTIANSVSA